MARRVASGPLARASLLSLLFLMRASASHAGSEGSGRAAPPVSRLLADLSGKALVVTGSTGGLGREVARCAAEAKAAAVLVCGRNEERGRAVVEEIKGINPQCDAVFIKADTACADDCQAMIDMAVQRFGRLDGLVNCAAICFPRGNLETTTLEHWENMMRINLTGPFLLTKHAAAAMKKAGNGGSIVNIGSNCAHGGAPFVMAYSVSKGALQVLTKNNAAELRSAGIRVNQINMGWCFTDAENAGQVAEKGEGWLAEADASSDMGRILRPIDTAASVIHLLSDASAMVTGAVLDISPDVIVGMLPTGQG